MPCIDDSSFTRRRPRARWGVILATVVTFAGCSSDGSKAPPGAAGSPQTGDASATDPSTTVAAATTTTKSATVVLPAPGPVRTWEQMRMQAARRMVAANPSGSYTSPAPDVLVAIPVLEIELNADGSIRRIGVLRYPGQAKETTQLAIDAVRRAAPFGDVSRLPKPWRFTETFLFDDDRRFKPRTLD